ncbi:MAG: nucleotide exchange factor GrpE [Chloroflexi bacterium]|nr:nucleotide exchange factor GrpE [Chloroflexota bacterium]
MSAKEKTPTNGAGDTPGSTPPADSAAGTAQPDTAPSVSALQEQLTAAQNQAQAYLEALQRERADFINYKRRSERELRDAAANASVNLLTTLLPIIDDFEMAMSTTPPELQGHAWMNGMQLVYRKFYALLENTNVTVIDPLGQPFDPVRHEALITDDSGESGHVTATLQKGYAWGDKVLRPARVKVAK